MGRKVFGESLKNAMGDMTDSLEPVEPARTSPTILRAQASVLEEDKQATRLIDPAQVRMSAVMDRIDPSDGLEDLVSSIREHGQKVPIMVRKIPGGAHEIVYGRRRLLACLELGIRIRATITEMSDEEAVIAQGVENNTRQDPSFIERSLFVASIIRKFGQTPDTRKNAQAVAHRALQIDESLVSRMNRITGGIPLELIKAIGPAHGVGRRSWEKLLKLSEASPDKAREISAQISKDLSGPDRIQKAIDLLTRKDSPEVPSDPVAPVTMKRRGNRITLEADPELIPDLVKAVQELVSEYLDRGQDIASAPEDRPHDPDS